MKLLKIGVLLLVGSALLLGSCSGGQATRLKDGNYEIKSEKTDQKGGCGLLKVTVKDGKMDSVVFQTLTKEGKVKDESYAKELEATNPALYEKAQASVKANEEYAAQFQRYGTLEDLDAVSGATWNFDLMKDCVTIFLKEVQEK